MSRCECFPCRKRRRGFRTERRCDRWNTDSMVCDELLAGDPERNVYRNTAVGGRLFPMVAKGLIVRDASLRGRTEYRCTPLGVALATGLVE